MNRYLPFVFASLAAGSLVACPGSLEDPARFDGSFGTTTVGDAAVDAEASAPVCGDIPTTLFQPVCAIGGCHAKVNPSSGLDLQSAGVSARLVGVAATGGPGDLIDPSGDPSKSVLYEKLGPTPPFGSQMPLSGAKLGSNELACVAAWIRSQAADGADAATSDASDVFDASDAPDD